jgi:hypothetical protein
MSRFSFLKIHSRFLRMAASSRWDASGVRTSLNLNSVSYDCNPTGTVNAAPKLLACDLLGTDLRCISEGVVTEVWECLAGKIEVRII